MTVRRIMILLYGAGGVPGRGEIPMIQITATSGRRAERVAVWVKIIATT